MAQKTIYRCELIFQTCKVLMIYFGGKWCFISSCVEKSRLILEYFVGLNMKSLNIDSGKAHLLLNETIFISKLA